MLTLDHVLTCSLKDPSVLEHLGPALQSDLVLSNPFYKRLITFADDFVRRFDTLPQAGDWELWMQHLPEGVTRDGTREALQRLLSLDVTTYTPAYVAEAALPLLQQAAVRTARARLNEVTDLPPEAFVTLAEQVGALHTNGAGREKLWPTIGELMTGQATAVEAEPEPDEVIPRLAWRGRHVLLAGLPKIGKSTLVASGVTAVTRGAEFLDGQALYGRVLWLGLDEATGDAIPRLLDGGARRDRFAVRNPADPVAFLRPVLEGAYDHVPDLVIVDTLIEYARRTTREPPKSGDAGGWAQVVRPLTQWAHEHGVAILTIHHSRRSDGRFRDSGEIAGAVDAVITMFEPTPRQDPETRRIEMVGRRSLTRRRNRWTVRLVSQTEDPEEANQLLGPQTRDTYELGTWAPEDPEPGEDQHQLARRITEYVTTHPGCSQNNVIRNVQGKNQTITSGLADLVEHGAIRRDRQGRGYVYTAAPEDPIPDEDEEDPT